MKKSRKKRNERPKIKSKKRSVTKMEKAFQEAAVSAADQLRRDLVEKELRKMGLGSRVDEE